MHLDLGLRVLVLHKLLPPDDLRQLHWSGANTGPAPLGGGEHKTRPSGWTSLDLVGKCNPTGDRNAATTQTQVQRLLEALAQGTLFYRLPPPKPRCRTAYLVA